MTLADLHPAAEFHRLRKEIVRYLEASGISYKLSDISVSRQRGKFVVHARGRYIALFETSRLADFLQRSPEWLRQLIAHAERLEAEAFDNRSRNRRLSGVEAALLRADRVGLHTKDGQAEVREALRLFEENSDAERARRHY